MFMSLTVALWGELGDTLGGWRFGRTELCSAYKSEQFVSRVYGVSGDGVVVKC